MNIKQKILIMLALLAPLPALANTELIPDVSLTTHTGITAKSPRKQQTTTFNQKELQNSPSSNLSELLQQEQSTIRLTNNSGDTSQTALSIRGFGDNAGQNTLILVDGFPLVNASMLAPNFNSIPLTDIERIDIYQGSKGVLWGNQAVGGVLNITTRHPQKFFANGVLSVGSYHTVYTNIIAADKFKHGIFIKVFGVFAQADNFRQHNQTRGNNIALQTGVDDAAGTTWINIQSFQNTTNFPGGLSLQQMQSHPELAVNFNNFSNYRTNLVQLFNQHSFSDNWLFETRVSQHTTNGNGQLFIDFTTKDTVFSFDPRVIGHLRGNKIIFGYDGQLSQYQLDNVKVHANSNAQQNDGYLELTSPLNEQFDLTLGARKAWQDNASPDTLNQVFVSEQGINYHPQKNLSFYLRRDGNFRFPKANEQASAQTANVRLYAQTGVSYETGMVWNDQRSNLQLNFYRLDLHNEIAFDPEQTALQPFGAWSNLDQTRRNGVTIAEIFSLNDKTKLDAQINYVRARFVDGNYSGNTIPAVPAFTGNAGISYLFRDHWQFKYFLTYTGTRYASNDVNNIGATLNKYWLNNAAVQYSKKNYILSLELMNLFNQTYAGYAFYTASSRTNTYYPAAGRNILLTLKVNIE